MATYKYRIVAKAGHALPDGADDVYTNRALAISTARAANRLARSRRLDPLNTKATFQIKPERVTPAQPSAVGVHTEGA